jgi:translocation and assembly module TamB
MSDQATQLVTKSRLRKLAIIGGVLIVLMAGLVWYLSSPQFQNWTRGRLITRLEDMTGGRVEIGSFSWTLSRLEFDVRNLTIHGEERQGEVPYAHVDRLLVHVKILSVMQREIGLRSLQIDRPIVHLIVYPDGQTNQPMPKVVRKTNKTPVQTLFELAIQHAEINDGQLILNEQRMPLDFSADNLKVVMDYLADKHRYDGQVAMKGITAKYAKFLPTNAETQMKFSLFPDQLELSEFHLISGGSRLEATGRLTNFLKPLIEVNYRATLNGPELARITKVPSVRAGTMDLNGNARYETTSFISNGRMVIHDLDYRANSFQIPSLDAAGEFALDLRKLTISKLVARSFGGIFKGDITVANWSGAPLPNGEPSSRQTGTVDFRIESLPVGIAADAFSTNKLDLRRLRLAGNGTGKLEARWTGDVEKAIANIQLDVIPPARVREGELPVTADVKAALNAGSGVLRVESMNVSIPDIHMTAAGVVGGPAEHLRLSLAVSDLSRVRPMLVTLDQSRDVPDLTGSMTFEGDVSGTLKSPTIAGHIEAAKLTVPLSAFTIPKPYLEGVSHHQAQPQQIELDSASADVTYTPESISIRNGVAKRAGAQASFDLVAGLIDGTIADGSSLALKLLLKNAPLADLQQVAGYNYPITGTVAADVNISGTKGNPEGGGRIQVTDATAYGEPIKSASADLQLSHQEARVQNLHVVHNGAQITGDGSYNLKNTSFQFHLVGSNFQLATIRKLNSGRANVAGLFAFNAVGSGTVQQPIINASARLQNFVVNGERVGDATFTAVTQGDTLRLTGRSNFRNAELTTDGTVKIREDLLPANISIRFSNFDFMPFLQPLLQGRMNGKSYVGGTVSIQGPLRQPRNLTVVAEIPTLRAELQGVQLSNPEPIRANMMNQVVQIENFRLVGKDTEMNARGSVDFKADPRLRLRANGRMDLKLVQSFNPDVNSAGLVDFNMNVNGAIAKPTVQGEVRITNGTFNVIDFPNGLSNVNGSVLFTEDRVQVQSLTAHTGGGDIQIGGYATYTPQINFNLTAQGHDIRFRYPQGVSSTADIDLKLTGSLNNSLLSGDVTITKFGFNNQFDLALYLARSNRPPDTPRASPLNNLRLNVHLVSTPELQVQSSLAKLAGNVDLNVRGVASNPVVLGRVSASEGQISLNGQTYRLERGDVTFSNPARTEPSVDIEATTRVREYDLTIRMVGQPARGLKPTFRSDPPLPDADILNLLAFGRTREETEIAGSQTSTSYTNSVSDAVLGQAINTAVSGRVQRLFGVSRVKISPELSGSTQTTNPTAQVTIEQQVSDKVTITYATNLAQSSQQSIFVEYNLNRNVSLIAGRDQYGVVSFDVRIRQRKR